MEKKEYQLPKEFGEKWVTALRSGDYQQGISALYDTSKNSYCCLGVAGSICGASINLMDGEGFLLPRLKEFHIPDLLKTSSDDTDFIQSVTSMNDNGSSFNDIADWIEKNVEFI